MNDSEIKLLGFLSKNKHATIKEIEKSLGISPNSIASIAEQLSASGAVETSKQNVYSIKITDEGKSALEEGFPEEKLIKSLSASGGKEKLSKIGDNIGLIWAKKNKWVDIEGAEVGITKKGTLAAEAKEEYEASKILSELSKGKNEDIERIVDAQRSYIDILIKRKMIELKRHSNISHITITQKGAELLESNDGAEIDQLSRDIITGMKWKGKKFRPYTIEAPAEKVYPARLHPLHEFIDYVRSIWLNMGFTEVSGPIIESAFWNFDALFSPQDHPTRDMQDTFFLSNPKQLNVEDLEILNRVKKMHQKGWGEVWRADLAKQALLRTHLTSVSARNMKTFRDKRASEYPIKVFSIGRAFRNESIDYKHLAEFYQTDGIVIGSNLTLANLMSIMKSFYSKLHIDVKFMPSYFPFVEPGLQVYYHDDKLDDNVELIGAGVIRKEISKAIGTSKTILAWGGGIDRLMFNFFDIDSIVDLYKNDVGWLRTRGDLKL